MLSAYIRHSITTILITLLWRTRDRDRSCIIALCWWFVPLVHQNGIFFGTFFLTFNVDNLSGWYVLVDVIDLLGWQVKRTLGEVSRKGTPLLCLYLARSSIGYQNTHVTLLSFCIQPVLHIALMLSNVSSSSSLHLLLFFSLLSFLCTSCLVKSMNTRVYHL